VLNRMLDLGRPEYVRIMQHAGPTPPLISGYASPPGSSGPQAVPPDRPQRLLSVKWLYATRPLLLWRKLAEPVSVPPEMNPFRSQTKGFLPTMS
jgi:hypothetical protein